ncbi:MAG: CBS domain-containing protein [Desulforhabdus sp.]|nr:CBS domain-containing protein [Desulforhabdus sp.]
MSTAKDLMTTKFHALRPDMSVADAVKSFKEASENEERKVFGIMVTDRHSRLVGMLSMYDILLYLRPKHVHIWGMMDDIEAEGLMDQACERLKSIRVADIMTPDVITVTSDTHLMVVLDLMIKKHIRRVPVVEGEKIKGIIYISTLFYHLLARVKS